ncbi:hypothetical protein CNEO2_30160 [Clostridium neonatale]|nr:hypothetical protein [Clostridium neonatale]CAG9703593.1 hypothetical protein CNEO_180039 [Clostridium neonatale]CAI3197340.1 hypothetical protein CNEO2_10022 [Clostridium neonatale]CAI3207272.1 hypothetical protein CNEO2_30022 [Clostridium neonatale]CAI3225455.1 hypothetical protein CNEO2_180022 [Clostridium neonatale]CAI3238563.1 hypothetical protein CNEO2_20073 [Clostridium neonatale]
MHQNFKEALKFSTYPLKKSRVVSTYLSLINLFIKEHRAHSEGPVGIRAKKNIAIFSNFISNKYKESINSILHNAK